MTEPERKKKLKQKKVTFIVALVLFVLYASIIIYDGLAFADDFTSYIMALAMLILSVSHFFQYRALLREGCGNYD